MIKQPKIHAGHIEVAVANLLGWRIHTIVPNVSWGLELKHECDLLVLDTKNRLTEVEIKITTADLKADFKKKHGHRSKIISRLCYAMPENMIPFAKQHCPQQTGLISVVWNDIMTKFEAKWVRLVRYDKSKPPISDHLAFKMASLGCMRIWSLKEILYKT